MAKKYPPKQLSDHGRKVARACILAGETLAVWAKAHGHPFRNVGTYSGDRLIVTGVESAFRMGKSTKEAGRMAARAYAAFIWNMRFTDEHEEPRNGTDTEDTPQAEKSARAT